MSHPLVIIGGGMSGIAAAIRNVRFGQPTIILEQHSRPGGLNSYYYRHGRLFETGLHAMTNFADPGNKRAPFNILLRQLKLSRKKFVSLPQYGSEINFPDQVLRFTNDFTYVLSQVEKAFPHSFDDFIKLVDCVKTYDPFAIVPWVSAREKLSKLIKDELFVEMILCPLMFYGNSEEHDMDFSQFVIMFQAIFLEGFFRPTGTIKDFLSLLLDHYQSLGGEIRFKAKVNEICCKKKRVVAVKLDSGEEIPCSNVVSTVGLSGTTVLVNKGTSENDQHVGKLSFVESIYLVPKEKTTHIKNDSTSIFYSTNRDFMYQRPHQPVDTTSGVINFPANFHGTEDNDLYQIRVTHMANYSLWQRSAASQVSGTRTQEYEELKVASREKSLSAVQNIIGNFDSCIEFEDTFTPLTIQKYTSKSAGAVYGSPVKVKDGVTSLDNLFIAGTDQGFLGIVGAMLSGVTIVNKHILTTS